MTGECYRCSRLTVAREKRPQHKSPFYVLGYVREGRNKERLICRDCLDYSLPSNLTQEKAA